MQDFLISISQSPFSLAMATSPWVVPTMQSIHIVSIAIIFTSILVITMRVLGVAWAGVSIRSTVVRFAPWAWVSLTFLALTGIVLILAEPIREIMALSFWIKMILIAIGITVSVRFLNYVRRNEAFASPEQQADSGLKRNALLTLVMWIAIIFLGRFIAYDTLIWGHLSPLSL